MSIRIGIDVGGTFTHAVAIDNQTYQLVGEIKVPTTHEAKEGVARGIVQSLNLLLEKFKFTPQEVVFIAHSTTQATNAFLEGDLAPVGIVGMGKGLEGKRAKTETNLGDIELSPECILPTYYCFLDTTKINQEKIRKALENLASQGAKVIVAGCAFSVDDPTDELKVMQSAHDLGFPATASHEISQLYGLKIRTRTSAINASILPKMMETANDTLKSVEQAKISAPLMIMRSDGGVMDIPQMKKRPILTLLSGPAAGVAAALMYVKVSDGIFIEVGGTSTDISVIRQGKPILSTAKIGGHRLYLRTLDVRTVGLAGGSMLRVRDKKIIDVGPRSAHIAGLPYAVFAEKEEIDKPEIVYFRPKPNDPSDYLAIRAKNNKMFALTPTGAANILGLVKEEDYARGKEESARLGFAPLAKELGISIEEVAEKILEVGVAKIIKVVEELIKDYKLTKEELTIVGGGGGAAAIVPFAAKALGLPFKIAKNAAVISAIGVGLALVRDSVEKNIVNPSSEDILRIRKEVEEKVLSQGAAAESIEVSLEIEAQRNIVRATATGSIEMRTKDLSKKKTSLEECKSIAAQSLKVELKEVELAGETSSLRVFKAEVESPKFLGLLKEKREKVRVLDSQGVILRQFENAQVFPLSSRDTSSTLKSIFESLTKYGDGGASPPGIFLLFRGRIVDLSGLISPEQIISLALLELKDLLPEEKMMIIAQPSRL